MVTFSTKKKRITVGEHAVIDQEAIYACVIGLLVSERYLSFQEVLIHLQYFILMVKCGLLP